VVRKAPPEKSESRNVQRHCEVTRHAPGVVIESLKRDVVVQHDLDNDLSLSPADRLQLELRRVAVPFGKRVGADGMRGRLKAKPHFPFWARSCVGSGLATLQLGRNNGGPFSF